MILSITALMVDADLLIWMVIMDNSDSKQYTAAMRFWDAFQACVEENRIDQSRSTFYVKWAQTFYRFFPEKGLRERTRQDIEAFLANVSKQAGNTNFQVKQAEHVLKILYEILLPNHIPQSKTDQTFFAFLSL
jgi:chemotaxis regulatin CheY-phosphate phosphatase CheZ